jgi:flavin reductase (DIM6/NTAB) family NADH-FMN oxidoreductase RutF
VSNHADGSQKDTLNNVEAVGQFVVNVVPALLATPMHTTSAEFKPDVDEFNVADLVAIPSVRVRPPRVALSPIQMECELDRVVRVGQGPFAGNLILGQVVLLHVRDDVLNERGQIDPALLDAIGRMGGRDYTHTRQRFSLLG